MRMHTRSSGPPQALMAPAMPMAQAAFLRKLQCFLNGASTWMACSNSAIRPSAWVPAVGMHWAAHEASAVKAALPALGYINVST